MALSKALEPIEIDEPKAPESLPISVDELLPAPPARLATTTLILPVGDVPLPSF